MNSYEEIKTKIKNILYDDPAELNIKDIEQNYQYELVEPRKTKIKSIGSANYFHAKRVLHDICINFPEIFECIRENTTNETKLTFDSALTLLYDQILKDLEDEKFIRIPPKIKRQQIQLVYSRKV